MKEAREMEIPMSCPSKDRRGLELFLSYAAGLMSPPEQAAFERHIAGCPDCRQIATEQKRVWSALDVLAAPEIPSNFDERLYARIAAEERRPWWQSVLHPGFSFRLSTAAPVAAACAALAVMLVMRTPHTAPAPAQPVHATIQQKLDPNQIEQNLDDLDMLRQLTAPAAEASNGQS
jgi:anti-sigma factor RsiW